MKYANLGFKYMFKNFWYILLLAIVPALFAGFICSPYQMIEFMNIYSTTQIINFGSIFQILMPFEWIRIVFSLLLIVLVAIVLSMTLGQIENHMRSGKLYFKNIFNYVNNNIMVVLVNIAVLAVIYLILTFLMGSILFLFQIIFSGLMSTPTVLNTIFAIIICSAQIVIYNLILMVFMINIQNMISNGYSFKESLSSTIQLIGKNWLKLLIAYLLPYLIILPLVSLLCKTNFMFIANVLGCLIQFMYYSSLTMTNYFELSNTSRYDNRKYYNYNK